MAAEDTFESVINSLSTEDKEKLGDVISQFRAGMFAARSEEARVRLAHEFVSQVHDRIRKK